MILIQLVPLLLSLTSLLVIGILIGVLSVQQVYSHIKFVKLLFLGSFISFIGINFFLFVMRLIPLDKASTNLAVRGMFSLSLYIWGLMGLATTIIYCKPSSASWSDIYANIVKSVFLPFVSYITILIILLILSWTLPLSLELRRYSETEIGIYVPLLEPPYIISLSIGFAVFLSYPTMVFFLASLATENMVASQNLKILAIGAVGLAISAFVQPIFLSGRFGEAADMIRIPSLILITYAFRKINTLQSFYDVELRKYIKELLRRNMQ